MTKKFWCCC